VEIIDNQRDAAVSVGELREHRSSISGALKSVSHGGPARRPGQGVPDRVEQGQPELLGVLLATPQLHEGKPARLPGRPAQVRSSDVFPLPAGPR